MYDLEAYYNKNPKLAKRPVQSERTNYAPQQYRQPEPAQIPAAAQSPQKRGGNKMFVTSFIFMLLGIIISNLANFPDSSGSGGHDLATSVRILANMLFSIGVLILGFKFMTWRSDDANFTSATRITTLILGVALLALFMTEGFRLFASFG